MKLFQNLVKGTFTARPNRFIVECIVNGKNVRAYLPNPGRLRELLLPGSTVFLVVQDSFSHKYRHMCVAVEKDRAPVMLHTHLNNSVARHLIEHSRVPGLEGAEVIRPEVTMGRSRFDFLLRHKGKDVVLEVKSCTLFSGKTAMFPDALTVRGKRHLEELAFLSGRQRKSAVLFIVHSPRVQFFMPEYHTDLAFSGTLLSVSRDVMVKAVSVSWKKDLVLGKRVRELIIPWDVIRREARDRGSYIVVLRLKSNRTVSVGRLGDIPFPKGHYLYVGSAKRSLSRRIARHQRKRKNLFWHIDFLRQYTDHCASLPVRSGTSLECDIAKALQKISQWNIPRFGSSDCGCHSHLFGMRDNPVLSRQFIELLLHFRINRLEDMAHQMKRHGLQSNKGADQHHDKADKPAS